MKVYKYYAMSEFSKRIFTHQEVYFSQFSRLNDPFEIAVNYTFDCDEQKKINYFLKAIPTFAQYTDEGKRRYIKSFEDNYSRNNGNLVFMLRDSFKNAGVFCVSEDPFEVLMWSHYTGKHRGFCVEFDTDKENGFRKALDGRFTGFVYYNPHKKKNVRVSSSDGWPDNVRSIEDAKKERGRILAKIDVNLVAAKKRMDWLNKYQKFDKLYEQYEKWIQRRAVNSWKSTTSHIRNHVLYWYLELNSINNPEMWPRHFNDFKDWLLSEEPIKVSKDKLSKNSVNNIIKALNSFLKFLELEHQLGPFVRCECVKVGKTERRGLEAIYSDDEIKAVVKKLSEVDPKFGLFFELLCKTGMRANEALGLHVKSFSVGKIPVEKKALFRRISEAGIDIYGFILLRDQPQIEYLYDKKGSVPRKPLKGRREIDPRYNRYIPLIDKDMTQRLVKLKVKAREEERPHEEDKLLFGFPYQHFYRAFYQIVRELKFNF